MHDELGSTSRIIYDNRGNAYRSKGDYAKAVADYDAAIKADPKSAFSYQNRGATTADTVAFRGRFSQ
jgi:tetratricopeptide (TPR) repeat protein